MRATLVQIGPSKRATDAGKISLCPEMNAAVAARHSRTPDGIEHILAKVDLVGDEDKAIDSVFKFIDYGHRSIVDLIPLSVHVEGISLWLAKYIWELVHTGGGQETSTRYCKMSGDEIYVPTFSETIFADRLYEQVGDSMEAYKKACEFWELVAETYPEMVGITESMDSKKAERFKRNFVFDRSRYFIPVTCLTNMNVTTWGTEWIRIIQGLLSSPWAEAVEAGNAILAEIELGAPRLVRHAKFSPMIHKDLMARLDASIRPKASCDWMRKNIDMMTSLSNEELTLGRKLGLLIDDGFVNLSIDGFDPNPLRDPQAIELCLGGRLNRYDRVGQDISSIPVRYGWQGIAFAEIRDMNRHRPGIRKTSLRPEGFYFATDQIADVVAKNINNKAIYGAAENLVDIGVNIGLRTLSLSSDLLDNPSKSDMQNIVYSINLGNTFSFTHTSTFGHFLYECELRTGNGTHFRYRAHYKEMLSELYRKFPLLKKFVLEGSGEPE